jgi:hypothetical protein
MDEKMEEKKQEAWWLGVVTIILLASFTLGEFLIGTVASSWIGPLFIIAVLKAALIVHDYMHLPRLFGGGEEEGA